MRGPARNFTWDRLELDQEELIREDIDMVLEEQLMKQMDLIISYDYLIY